MQFQGLGITIIKRSSHNEIRYDYSHGPSGETRLHFLPGGKKIEVLPPSSRRQATVHRTVAFDLSSLAFKR